MDKITIFYSLATGTIKDYCGGVQTMDYYGSSKEDYNYGVLVTDYNQFLYDHMFEFVVVDGKLKYKNAYRVPSKYI